MHAVEIATASERLAVLVMGTNDLAKELHAELVPGRHPLLWGLARCVIAARFAGKVILDGVYNDIKDPEGFPAECAQGAEMGFDGKTLIHPSQLEPATTAFAPSEDEVEYARRVIDAFDEGDRRRQGRRHRRRPDDREPARRQRPPGHRGRRRHQGPRRRLSGREPKAEQATADGRAGHRPRRAAPLLSRPCRCVCGLSSAVG